MKILRNILIFLLVFVLAAGGFIYYRSRPFLKAYDKLSTAETFDYQVRLHVDGAVAEDSDTSQDEAAVTNTGSLLFRMMENNWVFLEGEYVDKTLHCECSSGDYEDPILEFYRDGDGETTLVLSTTIKCMINKLNAASDNALISAMLEQASKSLSDIVITDTQLNQITGRKTVPELPTIPTFSTWELLFASLKQTGVESEFFDSDDLSGLKFLSVEPDDGSTVTVGVSDISSETGDDDTTTEQIRLYVAGEVEGYPCEALALLTLPSAAASITIPENHLTDDQLSLLSKLYGYIEPYL